MKRVSEVALVARLKRKLAHQGDRLSWGPHPTYGGVNCYRLLDVRSNTITGTVEHLDDFARELGVLGDSEAIAS